MSQKSAFFVLEGIDGAGGETQTGILADALKKQGRNVVHLSYPDYSGPIAKLIHEYLHKRHEFSKEVQLLLYLADFVKDKQQIRQWLAAGKTIIADRYVTTTLAYQCLHGVALENALKIVHAIDLPVPDKVLLLDISAQTSIERKTKEKGNDLDRNESNEQFLQELADFYKRLAQKNVFGEWTILNGEQSIGQVAKSIWQTISPQLD